MHDHLCVLVQVFFIGDLRLIHYLFVMRVMQEEVCKLCCLSSSIQIKKERKKEVKKRKC